MHLWGMPSPMFDEVFKRIAEATAREARVMISGTAIECLDAAFSGTAKRVL